MTEEEVTDPEMSVFDAMKEMLKEVPPDEYLYFYRAVIVGVYDGDSVTADIDLGLGVWMKGQKLRLYGINTPELRGSEEEKARGRAARDWLKARLCDVPFGEEEGYNLNISKDDSVEVILETHKDKGGKYGRWLCAIWKRDDVDDGGAWVNLNEALVKAGHAVEYMK